MKLSIIVPVYNTERYLPECLDSLLAQEGSDIEIICVNDGSPDHSDEILNEYCNKDPRIRVINQKNCGLSAARNTGLRAAKGDYVWFVDSDDYIALNACKRLMQECLGKDPDLIIFGAETLPVEMREQDVWTDRTLSPIDWMCRNGNIYETLSRPSAWPFVWRNCIRRKLLTDLQIWFDESVKYGEDTVFQLSLLPWCQRISFISDRLYFYRMNREGSLMEQMRQGKCVRADLHMPIVERVAEFWDQNQLIDQYGDILYSWSLEFVAMDVIKAPEKERQKYANRLLAIWNQYGLNKDGLTQRGKTYALMIENAAGINRNTYWFRCFCQRLILGTTKIIRSVLTYVRSK